MIKITISSSSRYPLDRRQIRKTLISALVSQNIEDNVCLGVFFVGDRKMNQLNKQFMKKSGTTDVLSFPLYDQNSHYFENSLINEFVDFPDEVMNLGEIVVSYPQAVRNALMRNKLVDEEINFLVKHGLEHLLGKHHK